MTKILICDDHPIVSSGLREILTENMDYQIIGIVDTAREIGPSIHRLSPDLVFLDVNMQGENTIEQISSFKAIRQGIRVILFSSYNLPSLVSRAFVENADAYLLKTSTREEILTAVSNVLNGHKFIGAEVNLRKSDRQKITNAALLPMDKFEAFQQLTARELMIFHLVAEGKTESEIAEQLFVSKHTVHTHRKNLMSKLGLHSSADFVRYLVEIGS
ncbi:MAG: response regulator transcription factor [Saprospiraceae bacterium]|nr:response regulator transcription factor [Saprospiraceae bacterium]